MRTIVLVLLALAEISLTSADPERRRQLVPIENTHPLPELMAAVREYQQATGERVMLAWTALSGINTRPEDARMVAELTAGIPPARRGVTGAAIRHVRHTAPSRSSTSG